MRTAPKAIGASPRDKTRAWRMGFSTKGSRWPPRRPGPRPATPRSGGRATYVLAGVVGGENEDRPVPEIDRIGQQAEPLEGAAGGATIRRRGNVGTAEPPAITRAVPTTGGAHGQRARGRRWRRVKVKAATPIAPSPSQVSVRPHHPGPGPAAATRCSRPPRPRGPAPRPG